MSRYEAGVADPAPSGARPAAVGAGSAERTWAEVVRFSALAMDCRLRRSDASISAALRGWALRAALRAAADFRGCGEEDEGVRRCSVIAPLSQRLRRPGRR